MQDLSFCFGPDVKWERELVALGFSWIEERGTYVRENVEFKLDGNWPVLVIRTDVGEVEPLTALMGKPGLWKFVSNGKQVGRSFDLPPRLLAVSGTDAGVYGDEDDARMEALLNWALETLDGDPPEGWLPPKAEEVNAMIPENGLTMRFGPHARQGEVVLDANRLALRVPIVTNVPEDLPKSSSDWLRRLVLETETRWRMVRIGFPGTLQGSLLAEVDLTGAPAGFMEETIAMALTALRAAVEWIVASVVFLLDARNECWAIMDRSSKVPETQTPR